VGVNLGGRVPYHAARRSGSSGGAEVVVGADSCADKLKNKR